MVALATLIAQSFSTDNETQQRVYLQLQEMESSNVDQLVVNLACLIQIESVEAATRQLAALTIKAMLEKYFSSLQMSCIEFLKVKITATFV